MGCFAAHGTPQQVTQRCRIILAAADGRQDKEIAEGLQINFKTVALWRGRFRNEGGDCLWEVASGRGRKPTYPGAKVAAIIASTLRSKPPGATHWSCRTMAKEHGVSKAEEAGAVFPLRARQQRPLTLHTVVGKVTLQVTCGRDRQSGEWKCPARERWGLGLHEKMTPELEDRVCLTAALTSSYEAAAQISAKWGSAVDDETIQTHVRRVGQRAEAQVQARLSGKTLEKLADPVAGSKPVPFALVIMMDGCLARQRGADWGADSTRVGLERVAWREIKGAVIYRLGQAGQTAGGRGVITQKYVVAWQGDPQEFGRRVQTEARRRGLASAQDVFVVADGGVWIWNVQQDQFGQAKGMLDFYHASEHLWAVARSLYPADETAAQAWVEPLLSQLKHGEETGVLQTLDNLPAWCVVQNRVAPPEVERERAYFQNHREHLHYEAMVAQGCPNGSGAMESFCSQLQGRFKCCGQFWSPPGMADLLALDVARRNFDWDALWSQN